MKLLNLLITNDDQISGIRCDQACLPLPKRLLRVVVLMKGSSVSDCAKRDQERLNHLRIGSENSDQLLGGVVRCNVTQHVLHEATVEVLNQSLISHSVTGEMIIVQVLMVFQHGMMSH